MKIELIAIFLILILSFGITAFFYNALPDKVASHWNAAGDVDGWMAKKSALSVVPVMMVILTLLFLVLPMIDPLKENIQKIIGIYYGFVIVFQLFMLMVQCFIILWNIGTKINPMTPMSAGIAVLFFYTGLVMDKVERNWFIGIRTPWTLSSDTVWKKTHEKGAVLFKVCGVLAIPGVIFNEFAIFFIMVPVILVSIYLIAYSYMEFKREKAVV